MIAQPTKGEGWVDDLGLETPRTAHPPSSRAGGIAPRDTPGRHRLSDAERHFRALTEAEFSRQVTDLAEALGWSWCHWRALRNRRGIWQVPVEGPLGEGWPDLFLLRVRDGRRLAVELKRELGDPSLDQLGVLADLAACGIPAFIWRPSDLGEPIEASAIYGVLR